MASSSLAIANGDRPPRDTTKLDTPRPSSSLTTAAEEGAYQVVSPPPIGRKEAVALATHIATTASSPRYEITIACSRDDRHGRLERGILSTQVHRSEHHGNEKRRRVDALDVFW